jgi:hypothetical protein
LRAMLVYAKRRTGRGQTDGRIEETHTEERQVDSLERERDIDAQSKNGRRRDIRTDRGERETDRLK